MKKKSIVSLLIISLLFSFVLTACSGKKVKDVEETEVTAGETDEVKLFTIEDIKQRGKLVMGTNADYPPFEFHAIIDGKDEIVGMDIEIAKYVADSLGVELEIKDMSFNNLLGAVSTGMIDVVLAAMNPLPEREKQVSFTNLYYDANIAVLIREDDNREYSSEEDLIGKIIGVQMGTTQEDIAQEIENATVKSLGTNSDMVMSLKTGKIDCALLESVVAESFAKVNDDVKVAENLVIKNESGGTAIATQKGNEEFVEYLNELIVEMKKKELIDKWFVEAQKLSEESLK